MHCIAAFLGRNWRSLWNGTGHVGPTYSVYKCGLQRIQLLNWDTARDELECELEAEEGEGTGDALTLMCAINLILAPLFQSLSSLKEIYEKDSLDWFSKSSLFWSKQTLPRASHALKCASIELWDFLWKNNICGGCYLFCAWRENLTVFFTLALVSWQFR